MKIKNNVSLLKKSIIKFMKKNIYIIMIKFFIKFSNFFIIFNSRYFFYFCINTENRENLLKFLINNFRFYSIEFYIESL